MEWIRLSAFIVIYGIADGAVPIRSWGKAISIVHCASEADGYRTLHPSCEIRLAAALLLLHLAQAQWRWNTG